MNIRERLDRGDQLIGTFCNAGDMSMMECLGYTGLDYVVIDTEHGPYDTETMMNLIRSAESVGLAPFVRIADITHREIQRAVDCGAQGIVAPCIREIEDAVRLIDYAKFAPIGNRGFIRGRGSGFGGKEWANGSVEDFMRNSNERLLILPQCETLRCYENIEEFIRLNGIDGIFIGPFDLSIALGVPGKFEDPVFLKAIDKIQRACRNAGKPLMIFTSTVEESRTYLKHGFAAVAYNSNANVYMEAYRSAVNEIRSLKVDADKG